jgi:biotin carboxyl carrier protein
MKLRAIIADTEIDVEISAEGSRVSATVDGRPYELLLQEAREANLLLLHEGRVFACRTDGRLESGSQLDVTVGARRYALTLIDPKRLRSALGDGGQGEGAARIIAPMPGKVVRVLVEAGEEITAGDGILVVEAMKMQNEMKAPKSGTVVSLNVEAGTTVNGGDLLAVIE